jgi:hypothetical protein
LPTPSPPWRALAVVAAGVLSCGVPLWPIPYARVSMPSNPSASVWLLGAAASGALGAAALHLRVRAAAFLVAAGFVLAVMGRVMVETSRDPTSHNLWPFEVVIAGGVGLAGALLGAVLARVVERMRRSQ